MSSDVLSVHDRAALERFAKYLTLKVAQIIVQSRQGKKIVASYKDEAPLASPNSCKSPPPPQLQMGVDSFNLAIPELAEVTIDTKRVVNGEIIKALSKVFIVEISLRTNDGDEMILELWTVRMNPECDPAMTAISTIYYRMGLMLKSTLTISRIAPAYKISRDQGKDSYAISYRIYSGQPNIEVLGEGYRFIRVSELATLCGTIQISLLYRTLMTFSPSKKQSVADAMMVKSDHFPYESPKKEPSARRKIDLNKPLTAGAFVDTDKIKELHNTLSQQLPPELRPQTENPEVDYQIIPGWISEDDLAGQASGSAGVISSSVPNASHSKAMEMPSAKNRHNSESQQYSKMMDIPFADGSPITELATFYQEILQARNETTDWGDTLSASTDSDALSRQLKMFEEAVPEFDSMVASMCSHSDNSES